MNVILRMGRETKQPMRLFYIDKMGNLSERIIRVEYVGEASIKAYCFWRKKVRTFNIDNILSIGPVDNRKGVSA